MLKFRDLLHAFGLGQKKITAILNKEEGCTLEEFLNEEETVSECKNQNSKLLDYLCSKENLLRLIEYATQHPQDPQNKTETYK